MDIDKHCQQPQPSKEWQEGAKLFENLCSEKEKLYKPEFEKVFSALYRIAPEQRDVYNTKFWNIGEELPEKADEKLIKQALQETGFAADEAFCKNFVRYANVTIQGKKLQARQAFLNLSEIKNQLPTQQKTDGWQFVGFHIIASPELHDVINDVWEDDAEQAKGMFANVTDIPLEDMDEDEFDMVEVYNCQATFTKYFAELKRFGIIGAVGTDTFLNKTFKDALLRLLKRLATYIKENTDKQAATKNKITEAIKILDELPHWGLLLQILTLQGLCRWLESVNIDEGDNGIDEAQALYD